MIQNLDERVWIKRRMAKSKGKIPADFIFDPHMTSRELFYDEFTDTYYWSNRVAILAAELAVNRRLLESGYVQLAMYYDLIGHHGVPEDYLTYYWSADDTYWIDFDHIFINAEDTPEGAHNCHMIVFVERPIMMDEYDPYNSSQNIYV